MSIAERIFHSILFECIALLLLTLAARVMTDEPLLKMAGLALCLSLIAMAWNYVYNLLFDKIYRGERVKRTLKIRIIHGIFFEIGLTLIHFPIIMWWLKLDFLTVLILDIGIVIFFLIYAIIYNWIYDHSRVKITRWKASH